MQYKFNNKIRSNNKAISDIVAVVMLILIAIAAAVLIYLWLSGLVGSVHTSNPALTEKISITAANVTGGSSVYQAYAYVENVGSSTVTINGIYVYYANSSALIFGGQVSPQSLSPGQTGLVTSGSTTVKTAPSPGTPVVVEVTTANGVQATYMTTWP